MPLKWTNRSRPPSSGVMKPKPLSSLNHLTVPVPITDCPRLAPSGRDLPRPCPGQPIRTRRWNATPGSASVEGGFAGSHFQERPHRVLEVLRVEERAGDVGDE